MGRCKYVGVKLEVIEKLPIDLHEEILAHMPAADASIESSLRDKQAALDALQSRMEELLEVPEGAPSAWLGKRAQSAGGTRRASTTPEHFGQHGRSPRIGTHIDRTGSLPCTSDLSSLGSMLA
jgi:hypothetical protein